MSKPKSKKKISDREALELIRHALYDRNTADAIIHKIGEILTEAGFPYEIDD